MVMEDVYKCLIPSTIPTITQIGMVDFWFSLLLLDLLTIFCGDKRGGQSGYDGRGGFISQETHHFYFLNFLASVADDY